MNPSFGPWSTAIAPGNPPALSTFWKQRMARLRSIRPGKPALSRREFLALGSAGFLAAAVPTLRSKAAVTTPEAQAEFKGKLVLFGVRRGNEKTWVIEARREDGSNAETIARFDEGVAWGRVSLQRDRITFNTSRKTENETTRHDLWVMQADGGGGVLVEDAGFPCWSSDGKHIAFSRDEDRKWKNFTIEVERKIVEKLPLPETDVVYDWSPDGRELLSISHRDGGEYHDARPGIWWSLRQVYRTRLDGSHPIRLTDLKVDQIWPRYSPDGGKIAYECRRVESGKAYLTARIVDRDGKNMREVINFTDLGISPRWSPSWSPDGKRLIWLCSKRIKDIGTLYDFELVFVNRDGTGLKRHRLDDVRRVINVEWA